MKMFKNYVSVKGSKSELEAFATALQKAGFKPCTGSGTYQRDDIYVCTYTDGIYQFLPFDGHYAESTEFSLSGNFNEALKAATETI